MPTRMLRLASVIAVVGMTGWLFVRYPELPARFPIHFNVGGEPDDFGPRSSALWLGGIMTALGLLLAWLSTRPHVLNYPGEVTERNAQHVYRVGEQLMVGVLAALTCVYFGILLTIVEAPGGLLIAAGLAAMLLSTLVGLMRLARGPASSDAGRDGTR